MYDSEKGNFTRIIGTVIGIVFAVLAVVSFGAFFAMIWFGAIYGFFNLLQPLGFFDSGLAFWATFLVLAGFRFVATAKVQRT